ncbi:MAG: aminoacyl-tRNA hydrolase [Holosporales bacterium]|jgi:PTH1 family peptidyl-tRNA hydrolase|nr:aminoacyl-tRNA hydrolase [Holosporales bacterium]
MFLLVGLGNPGVEYSRARHNIGFMFADYIAREYEFPDFKAKGSYFYSEKIFGQNKIIIQKPQTFMNLSGKAVEGIVSFFKIQTKNIFVVHDDIDLEPLKIKIKFSGSSGGHNGIRNIDESIGKNYWRIRIGVGRPPLRDQVADYVLSPFRKEELSEIMTRAFRPISEFITELLLEEEKVNTIGKILEAANKT